MHLIFLEMVENIVAINNLFGAFVKFYYSIYAVVRVSQI